MTHTPSWPPATPADWRPEWIEEVDRLISTIERFRQDMDGHLDPDEKDRCAQNFEVELRRHFRNMGWPEEIRWDNLGLPDVYREIRDLPQHTRDALEGLPIRAMTALLKASRQTIRRKGGDKARQIAATKPGMRSLEAAMRELLPTERRDGKWVYGGRQRVQERAAEIAKADPDPRERAGLSVMTEKTTERAIDRLTKLIEEERSPQG